MVKLYTCQRYTSACKRYTHTAPSSQIKSRIYAKHFLSFCSVIRSLVTLSWLDSICQVQLCQTSFPFPSFLSSLSPFFHLPFFFFPFSFNIL